MLCDVVCLHRVVRENTLRDALWPYRFAYCLFFFSAGLLFGLDFVQDVSLVSTIYNDEYTCNNRDNKPNITLRRSTILYLLISFQINIQTRTLCWCPLNNIGNWTKKSEKKLRCDLSLSLNWIKKTVVDAKYVRTGNRPENIRKYRWILISRVFDQSIDFCFLYFLGISHWTNGTLKSDDCALSWILPSNFVFSVSFESA